MALTLFVLAAMLLFVVVALQIRSNDKLKRQTKLLRLQAQEIKKQMMELQKQNQLLADLNAEKQQIIGVVSHDLKGPFNRIFALIQLMNLTAEEFSDDQKDYIGKIHQIVADGLSMVRNLLDNRRLEDKGLEPVIERINAALSVAALVKNYRVLAEKKRMQIVLDSPPQAYLMADKIYLTRIMDNLLTNAIKFSLPGKTIWVSVRVQETDVEISVRDEGPGITDEDRTKMFQKYQRLSSRPTGGESSTGLGLYLVDAMVKRMGGTVLCESEAGHGATFSVMLKAAEPEEKISVESN